MSSAATSTVFCRSFRLLSCDWKSEWSTTSRKDTRAQQAKIYYAAMTKFMKNGVETTDVDHWLLFLQWAKAIAANGCWKPLLFSEAVLVIALTSCEGLYVGISLTVVLEEIERTGILWAIRDCLTRERWKKRSWRRSRERQDTRIKRSIIKEKKLVRMSVDIQDTWAMDLWITESLVLKKIFENI